MLHRPHFLTRLHILRPAVNRDRDNQHQRQHAEQRAISLFGAGAVRERFEEPERVIAQLREGGVYEQERQSLRMARALDRLGAEVKRISTAQAEVREAIWTPDKEKPKTETKLWTPGSKEPA